MSTTPISLIIATLIVILLFAWWGRRRRWWKKETAATAILIMLGLFGAFHLYQWLRAIEIGWSEEKPDDTVVAVAPSFSPRQQSILTQFLLKEATQEKNVVHAIEFGREGKLINYPLHKNHRGPVVTADINIAGMDPDPDNVRIDIALPFYSTSIDLFVNGRRVSAGRVESLTNLSARKLGMSSQHNWHMRVQMRCEYNVSEEGSTSIKARYNDNVPLSQRVRVVKKATLTPTGQSMPKMCFGYMPNSHEWHPYLYISIRYPPSTHLSASKQAKVVEDEVIARYPYTLQMKGVRSGKIIQKELYESAVTIHPDDPLFKLDEVDVGIVCINPPALAEGVQIEMVKVVHP